ncbi:hypothetical protein ABZ897_58540, partial [Nonomuraea sp. NPDC046802]|uniref:hypothetical protein n=1 Tax=Nonomuraea sp. NPDC046802 TaxID=3154919 RepID=UPI0033D9E9C3
LIGHPTILPRHGGLVGEGHRHCLDRPVSPCFASKGLMCPMYHSSLTEREAAARIQSAAAKNPGSDTARDEFDRRAQSAGDKNEARDNDDDDGEGWSPALIGA